MYILQLFDNYAATYSLLVIGLVESLALSWVYGELIAWKQGEGEHLAGGRGQGGQGPVIVLKSVSLI